MNIELKKAVREQVLLRIGLIGPSGSGKTYSALRLAMGIQAVTKKPTLLADTENGRGKIYANEFDYYYEPFESPHSPERYIELIDAAEKAGVGQLIIDSSSHEWKYLLSALDTVKNNGSNKNDFAGWAKITPRHDTFINKIIQAKLHLLILMRGKDEYVLEEQGGKKVPKKVGVGAVMRDGLEYECNAAFTLDIEGNLATPVKDDTHRFEDQRRRLTEEDGKYLAEWANSGIVKQEKPNKPPEPKQEATKSDIPKNGKHPSEGQIKRLYAIQKEKKIEVSTIKSFLTNRYQVEESKDLSVEQYNELCDKVLPGISTGKLMTFDAIPWPQPLTVQGAEI